MYSMLFLNYVPESDLILVFHSVKVWTIDILLQQKMQQLLMKTCPAGNYNTNLVMVDWSIIRFFH